MNFLKSVFGGGFTEDMAINLITDLMKKAKEEKGTECIIITMDDGIPTITEAKFRVLEKLKEANEKIIDLKSQVLNHKKEENE